MILQILKIIAGLYIIISTLLYFLQEKLIFFPEKLDKEFQFNFNQPFKEQYTLITLSGQKHNGITENPDYITQLQKY